VAEWDAEVGDAVSIESHRLRGGGRTGEILEVLGAPGSEYYRVRWQDGRETVFHPGSDAVLHPKRRRRRRQAGGHPPRPAGPAARPAAPAPLPRPEAPGLRAAAGDRLVVRGHHLGERDRDGEILEVLGEAGRPPFRVRWSDTGREALLFPGTDAVVEHYPRRRRRAADGG
jgi:hypothetical protein